MRKPLAAAFALAFAQTLAHAQCTTGWLPGWPAPMLQHAGQGPGNLRSLSMADPDGEGPLPPRLLATGQFTLIDGFPASGVAEWDGSRWLAPIASNTSINVFGACYYNNQLHIAGQFGLPNATGIARWDGSVFQPVGAGLNGSARCVAVFNGELYVGGDFSAAASMAGTPGLAKWNGTSWSPLGTGLVRAGGGISVRAMLATPEGLLVAGDFDSAGGVGSTDVALWTGTQWVARPGIPVGSSFHVNTLAMHAGELYAGGYFGDRGLMRWDAPSGQFVNVPSAMTSDVWCLASFGGHLYAGGSFFSIAGMDSVLKVARWDGQAWTLLADTTPLKVAPPTTVLAMLPFEGSLLIGGERFGYLTAGSGGTTRGSLLTFDGAEWRTFAKGLDGAPLAMKRVGNDIILAGPFRMAGGRRVNGVTRFDGSQFHPMGQGLYSNSFGSTSEIAADLEVGPDGALYACGLFTSIDPAQSRTLDGVARWDGSLWRRTVPANGANPQGQVFDLAIHNGQLFLSGNASVSGGSGILRYTGSAWQGTGWTNGIGPFAIEAYLGTLYAANTRWTGTSYVAVQGAPFTSIDLKVRDGSMFAITDGVLPASSTSVGQFRNGVWTPLGSQLVSSVSQSLSGAIEVYQGDVIAARAFNTSPASRLRRWDGIAWQPMPGDPDGLPPEAFGVARASSLLLDGNTLWVSGLFLNAGGQPSPYLARYVASEPAPSFAQHPVSTRACAGQTATFTVQASPGASLRWRRNGQPLNEGQALPAGGVVSGVATDTLTISAPTLGTAGEFDCVAATACGSARSTPARFALCCDADLTLDGNADQDDVTYLINLIGGADNTSNIDADLTRDGMLDQDDLTRLITLIATGNCP